jgi:DNA modification methylase
MKPYYQDDAVTLYNGDCQEVLQEIDDHDIVFSSPPYNTISAVSDSGMMKESSRKKNKGYRTFSDDMPEDCYQEWLRNVFQSCRSKCKGITWINHKTRYRDKKGIHPLQIFPWPFYCEVVWDRCGSITLNARKFAPSNEFIYGFDTPHYWDNSKNTLLSVWRINPEKNIKGHPCPFPVEIASRCIVASCPVGGHVLDPFAGSGTTGVAAKLEGRKATLIELDERYCEIAAKRLEQKVFEFGE